MTRAAMAFVLAVLVSLATLFAAGNACDQVPFMSWNDACLQSCSSSPAWTTLCKNTMSNVPPSAEVTVFALAAAGKAKLMYESTVQGTIDPMLGAGNLPADVRAAVDNCKIKYGVAHGLMASIADQLYTCDLTRLRQEYIDAEVAVKSCRDGLTSYQNLPLYATALANYDVTMVAYELGALIVGK